MMTSTSAPHIKKSRACEQCNERRYQTFVATSQDGLKSLAQARLCGACHEECERCEEEGFIFLKDQRGYRYSAPCPACAPLRKRIKAFNQASLPAL